MRKSKQSSKRTELMLEDCVPQRLMPQESKSTQVFAWGGLAQPPEILPMHHPGWPGTEGSLREKKLGPVSSSADLFNTSLSCFILTLPVLVLFPTTVIVSPGLMSVSSTFKSVCSPLSLPGWHLLDFAQFRITIFYHIYCSHQVSKCSNLKRAKYDAVEARCINTSIFKHGVKTSTKWPCRFNHVSFSSGGR